MSKLSKSPERYSFQKNGYVKRQNKKNRPVNEDYLKMFDDIINQKKLLEEDLEWRKNNLEWDLRTTDWILKKVRDSKSYSQNLYAALCNNEFQKNEVWPILKNQHWSCSWRYAGGILADMREEGDYMDWYCSGMQGMESDGEYVASNDQKKYVSESIVTEEIREDLLKLGWLVVDQENQGDL